MQPAFYRLRLAGFVEAMIEETARMLDGWDTRASRGQPLDVAMEITLLTHRIVVKRMFGADISVEGERIARAFETAIAGLDSRFVIPLWMTRLQNSGHRQKELHEYESQQSLYVGRGLRLPEGRQCRIVDSPGSRSPLRRGYGHRWRRRDPAGDSNGLLLHE